MLCRWHRIRRTSEDRSVNAICRDPGHSVQCGLLSDMAKTMRADIGELRSDCATMCARMPVCACVSNAILRRSSRTISLNCRTHFACGTVSQCLDDSMCTQNESRNSLLRWRTRAYELAARECIKPTQLTMCTRKGRRTRKHAQPLRLCVCIL